MKYHVKESMSSQFLVKLFFTPTNSKKLFPPKGYQNFPPNLLLNNKILRRNRSRIMQPLYIIISIQLHCVRISCKPFCFYTNFIYVQCIS